MTTPYTYCVAYFTYQLDVDCLVQSIRSVRRALPNVDIHVFQDGNWPLLKSVDCDYLHTTHYPRNGNLLGRDCCVGMQTNMIDAARISAADYVIKLDCDTLILKADFIDKIQAIEDVALYGWNVTNHPSRTEYICGPFYVASARDLPAIRELTTTIQLDSFGTSMPEDYVLGAVSKQLFPARYYMTPWGHANGYAGWQYVNTSQGSATTIDRVLADDLQILTFGNRKQIRGGILDKYAICASSMQAMMDAITNQ